ncbi:hypothetical protein TNCT1_26410 [Streptomyces sp. 1-11]|nr:hypothetical protein TNCT1_26410 [Streptomyces sp. 1-11]
MDGHSRHSIGPTVSSTVPPNALHCNALHREHRDHGTEEPTPRTREAWKHPVCLAAMISAVASLITALALLGK